MAVFQSRLKSYRFHDDETGPRREASRRMGNEKRDGNGIKIPNLRARRGGDYVSRLLAGNWKKIVTIRNPKTPAIEKARKFSLVETTRSGRRAKRIRDAEEKNCRGSGAGCKVAKKFCRVTVLLI